MFGCPLHFTTFASSIQYLTSQYPLALPEVDGKM